MTPKGAAIGVTAVGACADDDGGGAAASTTGGSSWRWQRKHTVWRSRRRPSVPAVAVGSRESLDEFALCAGKKQLYRADLTLWGEIRKKCEPDGGVLHQHR